MVSIGGGPARAAFGFCEPDLGYPDSEGDGGFFPLSTEVRSCPNPVPNLAIDPPAAH